MIEMRQNGHSADENKRHQVKNALLTIDVVLDEMNEGYRFDDEEGPKLFEAFRSAILLLKESYLEAIPSNSQSR